MVLLALVLRLALLAAIGPQFEADTKAYLDVAKILHDTGSFSEVDAITGQLTPFAYRMPLFHVLVAGLMKIFGANVAWPLALTNVLFSVCAVLLSTAVLYGVTGPAAAVAAGFLMALSPNSVFNSVLLLTDNMFAFFSLISLIAGLYALKRRSAALFFLWGLSIGVCVMIRPILQYYFPVPILLIASPLFEADWRRKVRDSFLVLFGIAVCLAPWVARNRRELGFTGLEVNQGVNTLVSTVQFVRPSTPEQVRSDPRLAAVRDIVAANTNALYAEIEVRSKLKLSAVETSALLKRIGLEVLFRNPGRASMVYLRNAVNIVTSPSAVMELAARLSGKSASSFPQFSAALRARDWKTIIINLGTRLALGLLFFVCAPLGVNRLWRGAAPGDKLALLLLLATIGYTIGLTSMVAGYDRYRLPLEPVMLGFALVWLFAKLERPRAGEK